MGARRCTSKYAGTSVGPLVQQDPVLVGEIEEVREIGQVVVLQEPVALVQAIQRTGAVLARTVADRDEQRAIGLLKLFRRAAHATDRT